MVGGPDISAFNRSAKLLCPTVIFKIAAIAFAFKPRSAPSLVFEPGLALHRSPLFPLVYPGGVGQSPFQRHVFCFLAGASILSSTGNSPFSLLWKGHRGTM